MIKSAVKKRILIIRMDRLGDVILSTPAISAVRHSYPDSYIAVMARPYARDILDGNPYINEVMTYDKTGRERGFFGNIKFMAMVRSGKFDLVIVLHPKNSAHIIAFLSGIPMRVGYDKKLSLLLTKKIPHTKQYGLKHEIDYNLDLLRYARIEPVGRELYMPINNLSEEKVNGIFRDNGITQNNALITIHPAASCPSRRWPPERFAKVADNLAGKYRARIIIIAAPDEKWLGDKVADFMKSKPLNLSGGTSVADVASILRRSKLLISNDSGPVHISCAVGTPVISIFSRSDRGVSPARWGPIGKRDVALYKDVGCEVCLAHNCKIGFKCLDAISVEDVLSAADSILTS